MEILVRGVRVADLKLHRLSLLNDISDDDGARLLICPNQIANEKVAASELRAMLIHGNTDMERPLGLGTFVRAQLPEDGL